MENILPHQPCPLQYNCLLDANTTNRVIPKGTKQVLNLENQPQALQLI